MKPGALVLAALLLSTIAREAIMPSSAHASGEVETVGEVAAEPGADWPHSILTARAVSASFPESQTLKKQHLASRDIKKPSPPGWTRLFERWRRRESKTHARFSLALLNSLRHAEFPCFAKVYG